MTTFQIWFTQVMSRVNQCTYVS